MKGEKRQQQTTTPTQEPEEKPIPRCQVKGKQRAYAPCRDEVILALGAWSLIAFASEQLCSLYESLGVLQDTREAYHIRKSAREHARNCTRWLENQKKTEGTEGKEG